MINRVYVELSAGASLPSYASADSAGLDVYLTEDLILRPGEKKIVPTGLKVAIPEGTELQLRPRSGLSVKTRLKITNSPGTIDADYRDEIGIIVENAFHSADLIDEIWRRPELRAEIERDYQAVPLKLPGGRTVEIYVDAEGLPYGTIKLKRGERICQLVLQTYLRAELTVLDSVANLGSDRGGGFGSTGR